MKKLIATLGILFCATLSFAQGESVDDSCATAVLTDGGVASNTISFNQCISTDGTTLVVPDCSSVTLGPNQWRLDGTSITECGTSSFSPDTLTGLEFWIRADVEVLTDVDGAYQWNDKSLNGWNLTQSTGALKPDLIAGRQNGLPGVVGDGLDDCMIVEGTSLSQPQTIYIVAYAPVDNDGHFFAQYAGSLNRIYTDNSSNVLVNAGSLIIRPYSAPGVVLITAVNNGASSLLRVNGNELAGSQGSNALQPLSLFGYNSTCLSAKLLGDMYEMLIYSEAHDSTTIDSVESYLDTRWDTPL